MEEAVDHVQPGPGPYAREFAWRYLLAGVDLLAGVAGERGPEDRLPRAIRSALGFEAVPVLVVPPRLGRSGQSGPPWRRQAGPRPVRPASGRVRDTLSRALVLDALDRLCATRRLRLLCVHQVLVALGARRRQLLLPRGLRLFPDDVATVLDGCVPELATQAAHACRLRAEQVALVRGVDVGPVGQRPRLEGTRVLPRQLVAAVVSLRGGDRVVVGDELDGVRVPD